MKKSLILIFIVFFLTGCSVEYNLDFNDNKLNEKIKIGQFDSNKVTDFEYLTPFAISTEEAQELYKFDYFNKYLNLDYSYGINSFELAETFNRCYELSNLSYDNDYYYILTSKEFKCLNYYDYTANEVKINFSSNHKIISSNADYVNDGTHTWIINKSNINNKPIEIKLEKEFETKKNKQSFFEKYSYWIISGILLIVLSLLYLYLKKKSDNRDKI